MNKILPLVLLAACSGPAQYERGTYRPQPNPTFNPTTDAPHRVGHPGQVRPQVPRSPHGRMLPQSPETRRAPGVWASGSTPELVKEIAGVPLPLNEDADLPEKRPAQACAKWMQDELSWRGAVREALSGAPKEHRTCVVLDTLHECLVEMLSGAEQAKSAGTAYDADAFRGLKEAVKRSRKARNEQCPGRWDSEISDGLRAYWLVWSRAVAQHVDDT